MTILLIVDIIIHVRQLYFNQNFFLALIDARADNDIRCHWQFTLIATLQTRRSFVILHYVQFLRLVFFLYFKFQTFLGPDHEATDDAEKVDANDHDH